MPVPGTRVKRYQSSVQYTALRNQMRARAWVVQNVLKRLINVFDLGAYRVVAAHHTRLAQAVCCNGNSDVKTDIAPTSRSMREYWASLFALCVSTGHT
eukprot:3120112-Rhodomonas_salina.6